MHRRAPDRTTTDDEAAFRSEVAALTHELSLLRQNVADVTADLAEFSALLKRA